MKQENQIRCPWCGSDPLYVRYHDQEWGRPVTDDRTLFEFLTLESAQAGLAWITILRKREGYRQAFLDFDFRAVAKMTEADEERLRHFDGIVKNRLKIHAAIVNARHFGDIVDQYGSFHRYISSFLPNGNRIVNDLPDISFCAVSSGISDSISLDMKRRGFKFFGTTICYAFLQATGYIDDHINACHCKGAAASPQNDKN
ncbi:MAG: DNA-3-methyladenine glycosylase I [Muribaculaceae bacterium]|nr:DNA-3-methyladenine glycosylase I [Muribaculaceae bacterium]